MGCTSQLLDLESVSQCESSLTFAKESGLGEHNNVSRIM
jgi:hypothetical protein